MRDDNSGWSLDGETLHITHIDATNTGTDFEEMKKWCCCSKISIQSCQEGTLDLSCQTNPLRRFPAEDNNISHQYAEKHNTDQKDKWKLSSAPSTLCQLGDALQPKRDHFTLANIGENDIDQCFNL